MTFRTRALAAISLAALLGATQAHASLFNWTLTDGLFGDNGTFAGTFTFDSATDTITNWNVTSTAGSAFAGATYDPSCSALASCGNALDNGSGPNFGTFTFDSNSVLSLTDIPMGAPGSVAVLTGSELGAIPTGEIFTRRVIGGQAVGVLAGAPEPAAWALMLGGFGLAGAALRAKRRLAVA